MKIFDCGLSAGKARIYIEKINKYIMEENNKYSISAILSLVLGIITIISYVFNKIFAEIVAIIVIIFGIYGLIDIKRNNKKGKIVAIIGIIIGSIFIIAVIVALFFIFSLNIN